MRIIPYFLSIPLFLVAMQVKSDTDYSAKRQKMVREISQMVEETSTYIGKKELDKKVMDAMGKVPRHEFIPILLRPFSYVNRPLPIGNEQTISQPYIVALMTDLAGVDEDSVVLEIGTGSGYQAAVLAEIARHVYSIEIIDELGEQARRVLDSLGYKNITVKIGDGFYGWEEHAPYDAILVTAAPEQVPEPLIRQLKRGGKLVIPVGGRYSSQSLQVLEKDTDGKIHKKNVLPVGFVPLTREE